MNFFESKLFQAVTGGDVDEVGDFLKHGLSVDYAFKSPDDYALLGKTLVEVAVAHGQNGMVKLLSDHKCDPSLTMQMDVVRDSICNSGSKVALKPYLKEQRLKQTCIYPCIVKRDVEMIQLLVSAGFDVNIPDDRGCTPIWHAVDVDDYKMARAFASSPRCDVNIYDTTHLYPLHVSAIHGNVRIASLLLRRGAHVEALTVRGSSPLILACKSASYDLARLLLLNGANPNHRGINGHTPISAVLENCHDSAILDMLVEAGATIDRDDVRKCFKDKLPLLRTCPEVVETLKKLASTPASLKMVCCLAIRRRLLSSKSDLHLLYKVQKLPLPNMVKEYLMLNYI